MALNTSKCNHLTPLPFKGLNLIAGAALANSFILSNSVPTDLSNLSIYLSMFVCKICAWGHVWDVAEPPCKISRWLVKPRLRNL